jgi:hypothetical protein
MAKRASIFPPLEPEVKAAGTSTVTPEKRFDQRRKRLIGAQFPEAVYRQFRIIAGEQGIGSQALLREALNDLFRKYGKDQIA